MGPEGKPCDLLRGARTLARNGTRQDTSLRKQLLRANLFPNPWVTVHRIDSPPPTNYPSDCPRTQLSAPHSEALAGSAAPGPRLARESPGTQ